MSGILNLIHTLCPIYKLFINYYVRQSQTIREFDSNFTARHFGYKNVEEYYSSASLHDKLHLIQVPTLCLSAADDPFQPLHGERQQRNNNHNEFNVFI